MKRALKKYKAIDERGQWMKKSEQHLEFMIAMKAAMETQLKIQQNKGKKTPTKEKQARCDSGAYAWKGIASNPGEPTNKRVNGKDYIYCPPHNVM
jgi:hypothetical protein